MTAKGRLKHTSVFQTTFYQIYDSLVKRFNASRYLSTVF